MAMKLTDYPNIEGSYGGQQLWWGKGSIGHHFGCGVIAGLDGLIHRGVIDSKDLSKTEYLAYAEVLWQYIRPNTSFSFKQPRETYNKMEGIGVYSARKLMRGLKKYLNHENYRVEFQVLNNRLSFWKPVKYCAKAKAFIEQSIEDNKPVHLLSWRENQEGYNFHWVTITGIETLSPTLSQLTIATWGQEKKIHHFEAFWQADGLFDYKVMVTYKLQ